ncbi:MAG: MarR family transcriptional regulator [Desulfurococcales archaeon]|jgi:DNA-binding transcriptional ArsR family regulator|nr:MarR family transcriptional regulator [Desulfurococcales archaeon]
MSEHEELTDTQLRILMYLISRDGRCGVREIARDLKLPVSTVHYNLKRLEEIGFIERGVDGYIIKRGLKHERYIIIRRRVFHRLFIYSLFFAGVASGNIILLILHEPTIERIMLIIISLIASLLFLYEAYKDLKKIRI